jgi:peptidoglycan hydrolase-like protein with peptidoglycan-binding domain
MTNNTKKILFAVPILVGVYLIVRQFTKGGKNQITPSPTSTPTSTTTPTYSTDSYPLKKGSYGDNVGRLQTALVKCNANALPKYGIDKDFGSETERAVQAAFGKTSVTEIDLINYEKNNCGTPTKWFPPMVNPNTNTFPNLFGI